MSETARDMSQTAQLSHAFVDINQVQVTSAAGPTSTQGKPVALPSAPHAPVESTATLVPQQLWDRAYDDLKAHNSELVTAYEKVLSRELDDDAPSSVAFETQTNEIEQRKLEVRLG
jgi:hypothetical protein